MAAMVNEPPILGFRSLWFPTRASGERLMQMNIEYNLNVPRVDGGPSLAETVWSTGSVRRALDRLPASIPDKPRQIMRRLLRPWGQGRYTAAYARTGGILNLFTPPWGKAQDEVWAAMVAAWEGEAFASAADRQEARRALEARWNTRSHPFWATLSPAQVMVGGGQREAEMANEFLEGLARWAEGRSFVSEGQALIGTVSLLRSWQNQRQSDGRTILETIVAERNELLARRARILGEAA